MSEHMFDMHFVRGTSLTEEEADAICFSFLALQTNVEDGLYLNQTCSALYWLTHDNLWRPTGYDPEHSIRSVFAVPTTLPSYLAETCLQYALKFPGGPDLKGAAQHLIREGVTALLNASCSELHYALTRAEILCRVNGALAGGCVELIQEEALDLFIRNTSTRRA